MYPCAYRTYIEFGAHIYDVAYVTVQVAAGILQARSGKVFGQ
jgi:hypothetical protein